MLKKELTRSIKQGHLWIYSDAIELPQAADGSVAHIQNRAGQVIACGIYCRDHAIPIRVCRTDGPWRLDDEWFLQRINSAVELRKHYWARAAETTGYRLVAGEGDGLPGLIVDRYSDTAVIKLDGGAPEAFYDVPAIAEWLGQTLGISCVVQRPRGRAKESFPVLGSLPLRPVEFLENGLRFTADVVRGQKTGFFLDQRDNRDLVRRLSCGLKVLNLFSYTGGFSIAAGKGGASCVTSVDLSPWAVQAAGQHWLENDLDQAKHECVVADAFAYLQQAASQDRKWDLVICDPPSFAPSQQSTGSATTAYSKLAQAASRLVDSGGYLALASCSSHVGAAEFSAANLEGIGRARRQAQLIANRALPIDHPTPLAMPELRYLKFQFLRLN
jgi:23S rRNA (cytosine1962-C5)-methyltransferase